MVTSGWGADWPDGYGFLPQIMDSRVIRASGGNTNLGVRIPAVDALFDEALETTDTPAREAIWSQIDKTVMENAVILPGVWATGPALPAAEPDQRVRQRRIPDVRLHGPRREVA